MSERPARGPIVIDADVFSAGLGYDSPLSKRYEPQIVGRQAFISFSDRRRDALWRAEVPREC